MWQPTPVFLPGKSHGQRSLAGYSPRGCKESDTTERLSLTHLSKLGFPGASVGKESSCQCRRPRRCWFDPWVGKIPWRRNWQPTPVFLPGKSHGQRSLAGYSPCGRKEVDDTFMNNNNINKIIKLGTGWNCFKLFLSESH